MILKSNEKQKIICVKISIGLGQHSKIIIELISFILYAISLSFFFIVRVTRRKCKICNRLAFKKSIFLNL